jgi:hypothetical protein
MDGRTHGLARTLRLARGYQNNVMSSPLVSGGLGLGFSGGGADLCRGGHGFGSGTRAL